MIDLRSGEIRGLPRHDVADKKSGAVSPQSDRVRADGDVGVPAILLQKKQAEIRASACLKKTLRKTSASQGFLPADSPEDKSAA